MQFKMIAFLGLGAIAVAAPHSGVEKRNGFECHCPKGKTSGCTPHYGGGDEGDGGKPVDVYSDCKVAQLGLLNLLACNVLNNNSVSIPITISLLDGVLS